MRSQLFLFLFIIAFSSCKQDSPPQRIDEALSTFEIEDGFKIELLASEPLIGDPVDMEIDEYGRLYVVEMPGYPLDVSGSGSIKLLSDTDGDGVMDKSTTFAENLVLPNSIMRWKNGFIVTDAPNVLYLEDTDNDNRADVIDTLLTGFALSNPQHNLNSPVLGLDNWIYLAHEGIVTTETYREQFGDAGREIYFPGKPESPRLPQNARGRSVRFNLDDLTLEELSSHTQFGQTFDQWGNHLLVGNSNHVYHEVIAQRYVERNAAFKLSDATQSISDHGNAAEVFPTTINPQHQLLTDVGVITSACGLTAYLGGQFPSPYNENVTFVAEPVSNLVHVDKIAEKGATFSASRIKSNREFLTSSDAKFRPVNLYVGPDGSLYVVDYYRQIIEHPEWMGKEVIESGELYNDRDKGRIYRISKSDALAAKWTCGLTLGRASERELVSYLANPNSWWRQNAQRILVDRKSKTSVALLDSLLKGSNTMGRLHALWTLEGMKQLDDQQIATALRDSEAGIRKNAVKLAEDRLRTSSALAKSLFTLRSDPSPAVRFQLLCTLGFIDDREAEEVRLELLLKDMTDKWVLAAALSASASPKVLADHVMKKLTVSEDSDSFVSLLEEIIEVMASTKGQGSAQLLKYIKQAESTKNFAAQSAIMEGIAQALQNSGAKINFNPAEVNSVVKIFFDTAVPRVRRGALHLLQAMPVADVKLPADAIARASTIATDSKASEDLRTDAIDLIAIGNPAVHESMLLKLLVPQEPLPVQLAALRALGAIPGTTVSDYLLQAWDLLTPQLQDAGVRILLADEQRIEILLKAIEDGKIAESSISWPRRVRLMTVQNENLRNRFRSIFTKNNEEEVNQEYRKALLIKGSADKGKVVFTENCGICHQVRSSNGVAIGPDLGTVHNWSASAIMANTLDPNLSISSGFDLWSVELNNGESFQGIISTETPSAITLRNVSALDKTINRSQIKSINALNMSMMPGNLNEKISIEQMADLIAFLKSVE